MTYNLGEYGQYIYANLGIDLSDAMFLKLQLEPQKGEVKRFSGSIGENDIMVDDVKFIANQYVKYQLAINDIDQPGAWRVKGLAFFSGGVGRFSIGDYSLFTVLP